MSRRPSHIPKKVRDDIDNPEWTEEMFRRAKPTPEMFPGLDFPKPARGSQKATTLKAVVRKSRKKAG